MYDCQPCNFNDYCDYCDYCDYRDYRDRDRILTKPTSETRGGVACGRCSASCVQAMSSEKVYVRFPKNTLYYEYKLFDEEVRMTLYLQNEDCV